MRIQQQNRTCIRKKNWLHDDDQNSSEQNKVNIIHSKTKNEFSYPYHS